MRPENPFRPGAGHMPPYLAGRSVESDRFKHLLTQKSITENLILTGLRGVGKTVLLEALKPAARKANWLWTGTDMSESASVTEERFATRLITDLSFLTSGLLIQTAQQKTIGFQRKEETSSSPIDFHYLMDAYHQAPGLTSDKLKTVLLHIWPALQGLTNGIVFAYDEAQILSDHAKTGEYPLSMLLEVFQSLQKQGIPFLLILTGLPTLFPKLVDARTYSERMFHVMFLSQLTREESREAIVQPTKKSSIRFGDATVDSIIDISGGYPYFIQFICREVYDVWLAKLAVDEEPSVPIDAIMAKLDNDFFIARWDRATDRERDMMSIISGLENCDGEFSVSDIVAGSKRTDAPFSPSNTNQILSRLSEKGLIFKNRHGKYSFAVPLLSTFIKRLKPANTK